MSSQDNSEDRITKPVPTQNEPPSTTDIRSCVQDLESKILRKITERSDAKADDLVVQGSKTSTISVNGELTDRYDDKTFDAALSYLKQEVEMLMKKRKLQSENEFGSAN